MKRALGVAIAAATALSATGAAAETAMHAGAAAAELTDRAPKKARYLARKTGGLDPEARAAVQRRLDARIGEEPRELVNIYNLWTHETLAVPRDPDIDVGQDVPHEVVNGFLRCRFTHEAGEMDERLVGVLVRAAKRFDADRVEVISAYRSEKHNLNLRKKGNRVARNSQHTHGNAVDFRIPGVHVARLHRWARRLRMGGVGYYPTSGFVHVDTAQVRYWTAR